MHSFSQTIEIVLTITSFLQVNIELEHHGRTWMMALLNV
jgi:hypothetical protein